MNTIFLSQEFLHKTPTLTNETLLSCIIIKGENFVFYNIKWAELDNKYRQVYYHILSFHREGKIMLASKFFYEDNTACLIVQFNLPLENLGDYFSTF